ncbi:MAG: orotate phosphoribosyltransferase [Anaerolineales bacterium]|nr:orotate phosphoribosyltransferase [Anaerolineales bacterium]MCA9930164.1 orotate phosphoribosyltransferase [Anaerolineales bacterium]
MGLSNDLLEELSLALFDIGAVQLGKFKLHSGRTSRVYLDLRLLVSYPYVLRLATAAYQHILDSLSFDLLAAPPLAGLPIGTSLCLAMDKPLIYPRKTAKSYGTGRSIEGHWQVGETAVIIDDMISTGDSILQAIVSLKTAGLQVSEAVVLIDTEQGGVAAMRGMGYAPYAAITMTHLLAILESRDRISAKERAKALKFLSSS